MEGQAVSTAGHVVDEDAIGVYSVGTFPQYRQHGYAEALLRQTLVELRTTGAGNIVLQIHPARRVLVPPLGLPHGDQVRGLHFGLSLTHSLLAGRWPAGKRKQEFAEPLYLF